jgi:hypothetical protein
LQCQPYVLNCTGNYFPPEHSNFMDPTNSQLQAALSDPAIDALTDPQAAADALNVQTITVTPNTFVTAARLGLLWGDDAAANFISGLAQLFPPAKAAYYSGLLFGNTGIDFGNDSVRAMADSVATAVPSLVDAITQLKGLAEVRTYRCGAMVTVDDVTAGRVEKVRQAGWTALKTQSDAKWADAQTAYTAAELVRGQEGALIQAGKVGLAQAPDDLSGLQ